MNLPAGFSAIHHAFKEHGGLAGAFNASAAVVKPREVVIAA